MTALATLFALLPLALGLAGGEASSSPRAAPTCCGAIFVVNAVVTSPHDSHRTGRALDVGFERPVAGDGVPAGAGHGGRAGDRGGGQRLRCLQRYSELDLRALPRRHPLLGLRPAPYRAHHQTRGRGRPAPHQRYPHPRAAAPRHGRCLGHRLRRAPGGSYDALSTIDGALRGGRAALPGGGAEGRGTLGILLPLLYRLHSLLRPSLGVDRGLECPPTLLPARLRSGAE